MPCKAWHYTENNTMPLAHTHWIFDMDGTLTVAQHDFEAIRNALGLPPNRPILESLVHMSPAEAAPIRQKLTDIELTLARQAQPQPGAIDLLSTLQTQGKSIGILTRNTKRAAYETLDACGLLDFFPPTTILSRECCAPKPSPDGIWQLLTHWQATPETAVMVGDYVFDLQSGRAAGTTTVHLDPSGEFPWQDQADVQVTSLIQLQALLV